MEVYVSNQLEEGPYKLENYGLEVVQRMVQPVSGTSISITTDNSFTSIPLVETLMVNRNLALVKTNRKNKREIRPVLVAKGAPVNASAFAFWKTISGLRTHKNRYCEINFNYSDEIYPESGMA